MITNINIERVRRDINELLLIGERKAGTKAMERAAKYVRDQLEEADYSARIMHFPILTSFITETPRLEVNGAEIPCKGVYFSGSAENLEGELVYDPDLSRTDIQGKIVLTDVTYSPPRPAKAKIAAERGALGIIYISFGGDDSMIISTGGIKYVWGNPTPRSIRDIPRIPAVTISRMEGNKLINRLRSGERLRATLSIKTEDRWVNANQTVGFKGTGKRELIIFGSPLEALGATAINNSAANAATLEVARNIEVKSYDVMIVFTDGHEIAEAAGSTYIVDSMWPYLKEKGAMYINMEAFGVKGATKAVTHVSPAIRDFVKQIELSYGIHAEHHYEFRMADSSFTGIGIPYYSITHVMNDEYVKKYHGAVHGWWYRSEADTIEHVDFKLLKYQISFMIHLYNEILKHRHIPYLISPYLQDTLILLNKGEYNFQNKILNARYVQLRKMIIRALDLARKVETRLDLEDDKIHEVQKFLIREISNVFTTISGKYDQDPYGSIWKDEILPGLQLALNQYKEDKLLGFTALIREMNRLYDALDLIQKTYKTLLRSRRIHTA